MALATRLLIGAAKVRLGRKDQICIRKCV